MSEFSEILWSFFAAGGSAVVISYGVFRYLGKSWIENKFAQVLSSFQHQQAKEMAALNARINGALDATIKSQEKEFEVLATVWQLANKALGAVHSFTSVLQRFENLGVMNSELRAEYVENLEIFNAQRKEILESDDPQKSFEKVVFFRQLNEAEESLINFRNYFSLNEIFIPAGVADDFERLLNVLQDAYRMRQLSEQGKDGKLHLRANDLVNQDAKPIIEELKPALRAKFFDRV